jgi:tetratricopeptide (TPR) repeat protein
MSPSLHSLPFIGRQETLDQVLARLRRPNDLRNNPDEFTVPGFFGLAGTGKSRLLLEIAAHARQITRYVVILNFDVRSAGTPGTPLKLLRYLIDVVEQSDRSALAFWRRWFWRWSNPFKACRRIIEQLSPGGVIQIVKLTSATASNIEQQVDQGGIPENLSQAFQQALPALHVRARTEVQFGNFGQAQPMPLILVLLDTIESAPRSIREWLPELLSLPGGYNTLHFNLVFVFAGRVRQSGILETELPPLSHAYAKQFVREYADYLLRTPRARNRPAALEKLLASDEACTALASYGEGIPLLLQLLVDTAAIESRVDWMSTAEFPAQHEARVHFVIDNYLSRLREQASAQKDDELWRHYYLLLYGTLPIRIPNSSLLRALLTDLPGTSFTQSTNYDQVFEDLLHEAFVEPAKDGSLVVHGLIREGIEAYLQANDPDSWTAMHRRAAEWFQHRKDQPGYFFHALRADCAGTFEPFKGAIADLMGQNKWSEAGLLLSTTKGLPLGAVERAWTTLFKSSLAWAENKRELALERLRRIYDRNEDSTLREHIAVRLEQWLGFGSQPPVSAPEYALDLLWWARHRNVPAIQAHALRTLGEEAIKQERFVEARVLLKELDSISAQLGDESSCALACEHLGKLALILGPLAEAEQYFRRGMDLYESAGQPRDRLRLQTWTAIAMFYQGYGEDACRLCEQAIEQQTEPEAKAELAYSLQTMGHMRLLISADDATARDLLLKAVALYTGTGDHLGEAHTLTLLADFLFQSSMATAAWPPGTGKALGDVCVEAAKLYKDTEDRLGAARIQAFLGLLAGMGLYQAPVVAGLGMLGVTREPDRMERVVAHYRQARDHYVAAGDRLSYAHAQATLGAALYMLWKRHDWAEGDARHSLREALASYKECKDTLGEAGVYLILGQIALGNLEYEDAGDLFVKATEGFAVSEGFGQEMIELTNALQARVIEKSGPPDPFRVQFVWQSRRLNLCGWHFFLRKDDRELLYAYHIPTENESPAAWKKAKALWEKIAGHLTDAPALHGAAMAVAAEPDDATYRATMVKALGDVLQKHPELGDELLKLIGGKDAVQSVFISGKSRAEDIQQDLEGEGTQQIDIREGSSAKGIRQRKR